MTRAPGLGPAPVALADYQPDMGGRPGEPVTVRALADARAARPGTRPAWVPPHPRPTTDSEDD